MLFCGWNEERDELNLFNIQKQGRENPDLMMLLYVASHRQSFH
jgi:hypothetical protein